MTALLLTLLTKGPYDGCTVTGPDPGVDRQLKCSDAKAFVSPEAPKNGTDGLIQLYLTALKKESPGAKQEELTVGGKKVPGVRYANGRIAVVSFGEAKVRAIGCESKKAARCDDLIERLAVDLPENTAGAVNADEGKTIVGREVRLADGCSIAAPGKLKCPNHELTWMHHHPGEPTKLDDVTGPMKTAFSKLGTVEQKDRECTIEGVTTQCRVLRITKADGSVLQAAFGFATVRGRKIYAQCNGSFDGTEVPPGCAQTIVLW